MVLFYCFLNEHFKLVDFGVQIRKKILFPTFPVQEIYLSATAHFTNLVFGITPFILNNRYPSIKELIKTNGMDKISLTGNDVMKRRVTP